MMDWLERTYRIKLWKYGLVRWAHCTMRRPRRCAGTKRTGHSSNSDRSMSTWQEYAIIAKSSKILREIRFLFVFFFFAKCSELGWIWFIPSMLVIHSPDIWPCNWPIYVVLIPELARYRHRLCRVNLIPPFLLDAIHWMHYCFGRSH